MGGKIGLECSLIPALAATTIEDLSYLTKDPELWRILDGSSLYMLVKRPCLSFKSLVITTSKIEGDIIQLGNQTSIHFHLPLLQEDVVTGEKRNLEVKLIYNNNYRKYLQSQGFELGHLDYVDTILLNEHSNNGGKFIKYITPDLIIERTILNLWDCVLNNKINHLLTFEVLYIGEAVRSNIWQRVENHEKIQQILSQETSLNLGVSISQEIQILFFKLKSTSDIRIINEMSQEQVLNYILQKDQVSNGALYFDIEKAFIKALRPKYNVQLYGNYPDSVNGMISEKYSHVLYRIDFPYTLRTESNSFESNPGNGLTDALHVDFEVKSVNIIKEQIY